MFSLSLSYPPLLSFSPRPHTLLSSTLPEHLGFELKGMAPDHHTASSAQLPSPQPLTPGSRNVRLPFLPNGKGVIPKIFLASPRCPSINHVD